MWELIKRFWLDAAFFTAAIRGLIQTGGALVATGVILPGAGMGWKQLGLIVMALGGFIAAGNKTPPLAERVEQLRPDELARVKATLNASPAIQGGGGGP